MRRLFVKDILRKFSLRFTFIIHAELNPDIFPVANYFGQGVADIHARMHSE
jgi:hypothetical protein